MKKLFIILTVLFFATPIYADDLSEAQAKLWGLTEQKKRIEMEYRLNDAEIKAAKAKVAQLRKQKAAKKKTGGKGFKDVDEGE